MSDKLFFGFLAIAYFSDIPKKFQPLQVSKTIYLCQLRRVLKCNNFD